MRAVELIERKRDGREHAAGEVAWLVQGYVSGRVAPEQMSAWAMAVVFNGLVGRGDARAHADDGRLRRDDRPLVARPHGGRQAFDGRRGGQDHDRAGAARGGHGHARRQALGRGLAHTGGTLDKLESIPGWRVGLSVPEFVAQVARIGCALAAQTDDLVPAHRLLYALRDVTGTVPAPGLIAASAMSKKLAAGADAILLDVKVEEGAFMPDIDSARGLAVRMRDIGVRAGRPTVCELTAMDAPLGAAVGNALEVAEACEMLAGRGPVDFRELVLGSAARMAVLSDLGVDLFEGRRLAEEAVASGAAPRALEQLVEAQGGAPRVAERPWEVLETAPFIVAVPAPRAGSVARCGALAIGRAAMRLGAGRERKEDPIDHAVGIVVHVKPGDEVSSGEPLAHVHARTAAGAEAAVAEVLAAYELVDGPGRAPAAPARDDRLMPELPEVETVRRRLLPHLSGRTLAEVEVLDHRLTDPEPPGGSRGPPAGRAHRDARPARQVPPSQSSTTARRCSCTCA